MKRDPELIRLMLFAAEDAPSGFVPKMSFDGYTAEQIGYHAHLLIEAGLATGADVTHMESPSPEALLRSLVIEADIVDWVTNCASAATPKFRRSESSTR